MKLVEFVPPVPHPLWKLCLQMGITDVIVKVNPSLTGLPDPWKYETLKKIVDGLAAAGLTVVGLEGDPFDMSPIKEYGNHGQDARGPSERAVTGATGVPPVGGAQTGTTGVPPVAAREQALAHYRELLESMARLGIKLLCYNFMVGPGWSRSGVREVRGGAKATYFNNAEYEAKFRASTGTTGVPPVGDGGKVFLSNGQDARCPSAANGQDARDPSERAVTGTTDVPPVGGAHTGTTGVPPVGGAHTGTTGVPPVGVERLRLTKSQVWANYEYFIKAVMPTAERVGVRMGLHPDDPCLPSLGGYARIFETVADYDRAYAIYPSPSNAVTFCQANFKLMLFANGRDARCPSEDCDANGRDARCPSGDATQALADAARHFGKRIAFIHVRDVEGDRYDFTELFHDQGTTDQFALMRTYRELGLDVPVRGDHVPEMEGDRRIVEDCIPGYYTLGRLFANGYLKALLQGTESDRMK